jgi:hypothetical protein
LIGDTGYITNQQGGKMNYQVTEVQNKDTTRVYNIKGPKRESVESFWKWLKAQEIIQGYEIAEN